jgi:hypothetical protein
MLTTSFRTGFRSQEEKRAAEADVRARVSMLEDLDPDERETVSKRCIGAIANGRNVDTLDFELIANGVRSKRGPGNPARPKRITTQRGAW